MFGTDIIFAPEGLVLKPGCSKYNDFVPGLRWIKVGF